MQLLEYIKALWGDWKTSMSTTVSIVLMFVAAYISLPLPVLQTLLWIAAAISFLIASYRVWVKERERRLLAEKKLEQLNQRFAQLETQRLSPNSIPKLLEAYQAAQPEPNLACLRTEVVEAHFDKSGVIVAGHQKASSPRRLEEPENFYVLIAVYNNKPIRERKIGTADDISARMTITIQDEKPPIELTSLAWLSKNSKKVFFGVDDTYALITCGIAQVPQDESTPKDKFKVFAMHRDINLLMIGKDLRAYELDKDLYNVQIQLTSESSGQIVKESDFRLEIKREPNFEVQLVDLGDLT
jgi:hypothetical protein